MPEPQEGEVIPGQAPTQADAEAVEKANAEAAAARAESDRIAAEANTGNATLAQEKAQLAEERAAFADERAKAAEKAKDASGEPTFSKDYVQKLREEAAKHRIDGNEAKAKVEELTLAGKTEIEKAAQRALDAEGRAATALKKLLRIEVAQSKNVPSELVDRLVGDTREELEKDADTLLKSVVPAGPKTGLGNDNGSRGGAPVKAEGDMNSWMRKTAGITPS